MAWNPTVLSLFAFVAAGIFAVLVGVGWRRRQNGAQSFAALMLVVMFWAAIYGIQLGFTTKPEQLLWQRGTLAISGTIPPLFLLFAYQYAGTHEQLTGWAKGLLACESIAFAGLAFTNPIHHLVWTRATLRSQSLSPVLDLEFAGGYFVHILFAYLIVGLALWKIVSVYFQSARVYRSQSTLLLVGATPAFVSHILYTVKSSPVIGLDFTPFVFTFTGIVYGLALFHFDLLERTPVAQRRAIELTGDGLLVVDADGLIVDTNPIARQVYDIDRAEKSHVSTVTGETDVRNLHATTTTGVIDGTRRVYELSISELSVESDFHAGFAIVLRDVTDRDAYEQRLEVANRVLRHNLRNDMNVILGYADLLAEQASTGKQEELVEIISTRAEGLVALSEKAHQMVDIEKTTRPGDRTVDAVSVLARLVEEFREEYPTVTVTVDCPDEAIVAVSKPALTTALRNVLENAAKHNETASLTVDIVVTTDEHETQIQVRDDGSGLPEIEQEVLESHTETPLQHSSGLGLWLTYWTVSTAGGEISVEASESQGTTIALTFPGKATSMTTSSASAVGQNTREESA